MDETFLFKFNISTFDSRIDFQTINCVEKQDVFLGTLSAVVYSIRLISKPSSWDPILD